MKQNGDGALIEESGVDIYVSGNGKDTLVNFDMLEGDEKL